MSDRIDELERNVEPQVEWLCERLDVQGNGYEGGPDDRALLEVRRTVRQLATIARDAEARALKAEAMCEWLAEKVAMGRHDTVDNVLDAARKAVQK